MRILILYITITLYTVGLISQEAYALEGAELTDHIVCTSNGLSPKSAKYRKCMTNVKKLRLEQNEINQKTMDNYAQRKRIEAQCLNEAQNLSGCQAYLNEPEPNDGINNYGLSHLNQQNNQLDMQDCMQKYTARCLTAHGF